MEKDQGIKITIAPTDLKGNYSNFARIAHTREEFVIDFISLLGKQGSLVSRIFVSPGHLKRIVNAFKDNLEKYENDFDKIEEAKEPKQEKFGFNA